MRRFFIPPEALANSPSPLFKVELIGDEFHHLKNVCRLEVGEHVELLDGIGKIAQATIEAIGKKSARLGINSIAEAPPESKPACDIILSIPRFQKMDLIIQKCVELGARSITPVTSDRSFIKTLNDDLENKCQRWSKIASESCKQSGRVRPLQLHPCTTLREKLKISTPGLFLYEGEGQQDIKSFLQKLDPPESITIYIGSEGGYSPSEVELFKKQSFAPVTLGPLVLRVETACITILSVIQYHFDLMR